MKPSSLAVGALGAAALAGLLWFLTRDAPAPEVRGGAAAPGNSAAEPERSAQEPQAAEAAEAQRNALRAESNAAPAEPASKPAAVRPTPELEELVLLEPRVTGSEEDVQARLIVAHDAQQRAELERFLEDPAEHTWQALFLAARMEQRVGTANSETPWALPRAEHDRWVVVHPLGWLGPAAVEVRAGEVGTRRVELPQRGTLQIRLTASGGGSLPLARLAETTSEIHVEGVRRSHRGLERLPTHHVRGTGAAGGPVQLRVDVAPELLFRIYERPTLVWAPGPGSRIERELRFADFGPGSLLEVEVPGFGALEIVPTGPEVERLLGAMSVRVTELGAAGQDVGSSAAWLHRLGGEGGGQRIENVALGRRFSVELSFGERVIASREFDGPREDGEVGRMEVALQGHTVGVTARLLDAEGAQLNFNHPGKRSFATRGVPAGEATHGALNDSLESVVSTLLVGSEIRWERAMLTGVSEPVTAVRITEHGGSRRVWVATLDPPLAAGERDVGELLPVEMGVLCSGRVFGPDGEPVARGQVLAGQLEFEGTALADSLGGRRRAKVDADGRFELRGPVGAVRLSVWPTDAGRYGPAVEVEAGATDVELRFSELVPLSGALVESTGAPCSRALLQFVEEGTDVDTQVDALPLPARRARGPNWTLVLAPGRYDAWVLETGTEALLDRVSGIEVSLEQPETDPRLARRVVPEVP